MKKATEKKSSFSLPARIITIVLAALMLLGGATLLITLLIGN